MDGGKLKKKTWLIVSKWGCQVYLINKGNKRRKKRSNL